MGGKRKTTGIICSRVYCKELATRGSSEGRYHRYCEKHYRFRAMRDKSRKSNKDVPTWEILEELYDKNPEMICVKCGQKMTWRNVPDRRRQLTLQHEDNGTFSFICYSCNAIHGNCFMENRDDVFKIPEGYKWCIGCKRILPHNQFHYSTGRGRFDLYYICKKCSSIRSAIKYKKKMGKL